MRTTARFPWYLVRKAARLEREEVRSASSPPPSADPFVVVDLVGSQHVAAAKITMPLVLRCNQQLYRSPRLSPGQAFYRIEAEKDNRIRPSMFATTAAISIPNLQPLEQRGKIMSIRVAFGRDLQKRLEHAHVGCLTETPWATEQRCFSARVQKVRNEHRLIKADGLRGSALKSVISHKQPLATGYARQPHIADSRYPD